MSNSDPTDFDRWITETYRTTGGFTALILLLEIGGTSVEPVASSYLHVIGADIDWAGMSGLLSGAGKAWQGVAFFVESTFGGGPVPDPDARQRLQSRARTVNQDRMRLNDGVLFDRLGRSIRVDPV